MEQLQIAVAPSMAGYNGVYSNSTYDLTNKMIQVESTQAVSQAGWCENFLELELNTNNYFMIQVGAGNMLFRSRVNGVNDQASIAFDGTANRFWRIRHDQSANLIYFETSANGTVWLTRKTVTPGFSLTALRIHLLAGAYGTGNSSPGTAKYDNLKLLTSTVSGSLPVPNAGFEAPVIGNGSFQYSPTGGSWSFVGGSGISGMNSPFTGAPSVAPDGVQVAFIQGNGWIAQSISGFQANTSYIITFAAIQRTNCCNTGGQDVAVYIDDTLLATFHPGSSTYGEYSTPVFTTSTGAHTIKFAGLNPLGGDHTAFIDNVRISGTPRSGYGLQWLVTDQLGTPRMVFDESGAIANVKRHDYLPFGEELLSQGLRSTSGSGYASADGLRQQFTRYERDTETGLDFAEARYYSSTEGRFMRPDPYNIISVMETGRNRKERSQILVAYISVPQNWNRYAYCLNNPVNLIDPSGLIWLTKDNKDYMWVKDTDYEKNKDNYKDYSVANGEITTYKGSHDCPQCHGLAAGDLVQLKENGEIAKLDPNEALVVPILPEIQRYNSYSLGPGNFSMGGIIDSRSQIYPTFGYGPSKAQFSFSVTEGDGPVVPGVYLQLTASSYGLVVNESINLFHPLQYGISREVGYGSPSYGVGASVALPPLTGTTPANWAHNPDNPNGKPFYTGRCMY